MCILCPLSEIREGPVLNITLHEECGSGRAGAVVDEGGQWGVGHSLPYLAWELASAWATESKPPSLRWRLGKLTDVCCKYVHCNAGTRPSPDRYNQPLPVDHVWSREGLSWVDLGIFWQLLPDRYLTSHASHITRKDPGSSHTLAEYGLRFREWKLE